MIDRPLRPLFPEGYNNETQVIGLLLSADLENDSDTPRPSPGASTALSPLRDPVHEARRRPCASATGTAQCRGQPDLHRAAHQSKLNLLVAGTDDAIVMVEAGAAEITEDEMVEALTTEGHDAIKKIVAMQRELQQQGRQAEVDVHSKTLDPDS